MPDNDDNSISPDRQRAMDAQRTTNPEWLGADGRPLEVPTSALPVELTEGIAQLPDVPEGHTRLFRAESTGPSELLPKWLQQGVDAKPHSAVNGQWTTDSLDDALWYAQENSGGKEVRLSYIDVPNEAARNAWVPNQPEHIQTLSRAPEHEYVLPPQVVRDGQTIATVDAASVNPVKTENRLQETLANLGKRYDAAHNVEGNRQLLADDGWSFLTPQTETELRATLLREENARLYPEWHDEKGQPLKGSPADINQPLTVKLDLDEMDGMIRDSDLVPNNAAPDAPHPTLRSKAAMGANGTGAAVDIVNIGRALASDDREAAAASAGSLTVNASALTDDILMAKGLSSGNVAKVLGKAGPVATVATTGVELYKIEAEGGADVSSRQGEVVLETGAAIGGGVAGGAAATAAAGALGLTGLAAGTAATGGALLVGVAAAAAVHYGSKAIDDSMYGAEDQRFKANLDEKQLMLGMSGLFHDKLADPKTGEINWRDTETLNNYDTLLTQHAYKQEEIMKDNDSFLPRWARGGESVIAQENARSELRATKSAKEELRQYFNEMAVAENARSPDDLDQRIKEAAAVAEQQRMEARGQEKAPDVSSTPKSAPDMAAALAAAAKEGAALHQSGVTRAAADTQATSESSGKLAKVHTPQGKEADTSQGLA